MWHYCIWFKGQRDSKAFKLTLGQWFRTSFNHGKCTNCSISSFKLVLHQSRTEVKCSQCEKVERHRGHNIDHASDKCFEEVWNQWSIVETKSLQKVQVWRWCSTLDSRGWSCADNDWLTNYSFIWRVQFLWRITSSFRRFWSCLKTWVDLGTISVTSPLMAVDGWTTCDVLTRLGGESQMIKWLYTATIDLETHWSKSLEKCWLSSTHSKRDGLFSKIDWTLRSEYASQSA